MHTGLSLYIALASFFGNVFNLELVEHSVRRIRSEALIDAVLVATTLPHDADEARLSAGSKGCNVRLAVGTGQHNLLLPQACLHPLADHWHL